MRVCKPRLEVESVMVVLNIWMVFSGPVDDHSPVVTLLTPPTGCPPPVCAGADGVTAWFAAAVPGVCAVAGLLPTARAAWPAASGRRSNACGLVASTLTLSAAHDPSPADLQPQ